MPPAATPHLTAQVAPRSSLLPAVPRRWTIAVLAFALAWPTVYTWLYFVALAGSPAMRVAYGLGKTIQFALPVAWLVLVERQRIGWPRWTSRGLALGAAFGAAVFVATWGLYRLALQGSPLLAEAPAQIAAKLADVGCNTPLSFLGLAVFYCLLHSGAEEYYWRWFTFGQLRRLTPVWAAGLISSLGFMSHHVLVVATFVHPWPAAAALSLAVAVGGGVWAALYHRTGSLYAPWLSHLLVDAVLMLIGYDLVWGV